MHTIKAGVFEKISNKIKSFLGGHTLATDEKTQEYQSLSLFEIIKIIDNANM